MHGRNTQLFIEKSPACARQFWYNDVSNIMKRYALTILAAGGIAALGAGCVERQVVYVPAQPGAPTGALVTDQAPPPQQVEVVPVAPGPEYVWMPGYWSVGVGGGWVWIGGRYAIPPRPPRRLGERTLGKARPGLRLDWGPLAVDDGAKL